MRFAGHCCSFSACQVNSVLLNGLMICLQEQKQVLADMAICIGRCCALLDLCGRQHRP